MTKALKQMPIGIDSFRELIVKKGYSWFTFLNSKIRPRREKAGDQHHVIPKFTSDHQSFFL